MHITFLHAALVGDVVAHWVALKEITVIQKERIGRFGPDIGDVCCCTGKSHRITWPIGVVIVWPNVHVKVCRLHYAQVRLARGGAGGKWVQRDH